MILEFWNIWSLNLIFLWATDPNFVLSGGFGHPYGRAEIASVSGRIPDNPGELAYMKT